MQKYELVCIYIVPQTTATACTVYVGNQHSSLDQHISTNLILYILVLLQLISFLPVAANDRRKVAPQAASLSELGRGG